MCVLRPAQFYYGLTILLANIIFDVVQIGKVYLVAVDLGQAVFRREHGPRTL